MLINGANMNIKLTSAPEAFYLLAHSDDTKLRIKILDVTLFSIQVELKPLLLLLLLLLLAHANVLGMKRKARYPVTHNEIKLLLVVMGPSKSLSIMNSLAQIP